MRLQHADDLLSVRVDGPRYAQAVADHLRSSGTWLEVVPGIDSVVVRFDAAALEAQAAMAQLETALDCEIAPLSEPAELVEIPVVYGGKYGPDLPALCDTLGMSQEAFIDLHTGREYEVDMVGFTPGFVFVGGLDERLSVPRREEPRQRVEAGSIGIADGRTGMYALASPGGWTLVGRTPFRLFDADAENPFPICAGTRIRFVQADASEFES